MAVLNAGKNAHIYLTAHQGVSLLRDAIKKQQDPNWECRSDHPALEAALVATETLEPVPHSVVVDRAAHALAVHSGWTPNGQESDQEKSYWRALAQVVLAQASNSYLTEGVVTLARPGEIYAGVVVNAAGLPGYHVFVHPVELATSVWAAAQDWAISLGYNLPTKNEMALLSANVPLVSLMGTYWHVTGANPASLGCARAIRRVPIS